MSRLHDGSRHATDVPGISLLVTPKLPKPFSSSISQPMLLAPHHAPALGWPGGAARTRLARQLPPPTSPSSKLRQEESLRDPFQPDALAHAWA